MTDRVIRIIGVPIDLGADRRGVDMGPSAIRYAGLNARLQRLGWQVEDLGNLNVPVPETREIQDTHLKYLPEIAKVSAELTETVAKALKDGVVPLVLGGDHSIGIGSLAGIAAAGKKRGLIWFDTHGDYNSPQTTHSGNIHGMPLAVANGIGVRELTEIGGPGKKISEENTVIIGARDFDLDEREMLHRSKITVFTMSDIDQLGMKEVVSRGLEIAGRGTEGIHVSFDLDVIDPSEAPGVGTPVAGGITYREAHLAMELVAESGLLLSLDMAEVNPILDTHNKTAELAVGLICSAFGKKIF
ncbi:arginase [Acididesulfobacillus acetoxydans]|uniref:Arginase n=1 Tax=Acididesulfobacillus acetoxydans TaxID=1561005 RepID=A0A8S0WWD5_9FIRM|nr:arginase [Acididesulfobacillus acetoxydans]CAA7600201.1 arginase [Acididesulfobacillus acetoxydans]CEJ09579.1 Arginase [Acididesulfobacillus acetoxydans]